MFNSDFFLPSYMNYFTQGVAKRNYRPDDNRVYDPRVDSPEYWTLLRKVQARARSIDALSRRVEEYSNLIGRPFRVGLRSAPSTSPPEIIKADLRDAEWILRGPKQSSFMPDFVWAPFPKIPNVRSFKVVTHGIDKLFDHFGIKKKVAPTFEYELYRNQACIRYVKFTVTRLRNVKSDALYWRMVHVIMCRSIVFNLMSLSKCFERWHRELPLHLVMKLVYGSMRLSKERNDEIEFNRVYIPKPNGKKRPLGVPTPVWRVYMSMITWFLVTRVDRHLPDWQHGFRPGRGVHTAWRTILTKVIKARYIYEFDLKGFFDNVELKYITRVLREMCGVPGEVARFFLRLNQSLVKLANEDEIHEKDRGIRYLPSGRISVNFLNRPGKGAEELHPGIPQDLMIDMMKEDMEDLDGVSREWILNNYETVYKKYQELQWAYLSSYNPDQPLPFENPEQQFPKTTGVPQGANTSPILSICVLNLLNLPSHCNILMYADDGLIFSERKFLAPDIALAFGQVGIEINEEKSSWVRENYKWRHPLKFLGLTYDACEDPPRLHASTRKGATLEYDKSGLVSALEVRLNSSSITPCAVAGDSPHPFEEYIVWSPTGESWSYPTLKAAREQQAALQAGATSWIYKIGRLTPDGVILTDDIDSRNVWGQLAKSRIFGLILSRMQSDTWNMDVDQDFRLKYVGNSWVSKRQNSREMKAALKGVKLTFANSTSFAFHDVTGIIRKSRSNLLWKSRYKAGLLSLSELNARRHTIGYPPFSEKSTYMRRFRIVR